MIGNQLPITMIISSGQKSLQKVFLDYFYRSDEFIIRINDVDYFSLPVMTNETFKCEKLDTRVEESKDQLIGKPKKPSNSRPSSKKSKKTK